MGKIAMSWTLVWWPHFSQVSDLQGGLLRNYHAVGYDYLKYSWEYFMRKKCMTYSCIVDHPNIFGNFCCLLGRTNWERIT